MKPTPTSEADGADWRQRFADYTAARAAHQRAQACADELQARLSACTTDHESAAVGNGAALAVRRLTLASEQLALATSAFTQGRSVLEAIWNAPDEI
jgi:hypothetical protein